MKCPKCQAENPEGAKFCVECGQSLQPKTVCPQCGHTSPEGSKFCAECGHALAEPAPTPTAPPSPEPTSFVGGRYQVKRFLAEGGKKKVYQAHDGKLDRDVAFKLHKTEKLDDEARTRITREAKAMGRLGSHQHIVTVFDQGEHEGHPYIVEELMAGGDVEGLIEKAPEHRLSLEQAIDIAKSVCLGLEFAHSKDIIHRDLKPGNVMLSADGTAKIDDFGLAVAVDLSRLTQSGMMVGTAFYMPPEQAIGQEVTPRADLYSLGAMLYEMVTGRPPFIGDTSVAIITQHIDSSPPISPAWHRADIPPSLAALIMQLLEKDPQKRPASASEVIQVLESIEAGKVAEAVSKEAPTIDRGPLYGRVFVGRESELRQLQSAFDGAMSGQGALMMVVGEPGIGKTAICEQISTYATLRGGKPLVGHCYEEGSLSLPYLAFVEAMRSYVLSREVKDLRKELGTGAADVARIVSEIRERLKVKPRPSGDPEEERYRLMQAVTSFLANAARVQPLLIILEDLHDADKGTLEMLTYIARNLTGARLLIIGTYRDVEVDRAHPLSGTLAELKRVASYDRVPLKGLNADEVSRMMNAISGLELPWSLAETVHRRTEGNPLFIQEVLRYLRESGAATGDYGRWQTPDLTRLEMSIPEGLRDVIGKRLSLLSSECNRILRIAAVIGREFQLNVLQCVAGISDDELFAILREAKGAVVVEERSSVGAAVIYFFAHAFFQQTLSEEMIAPERIRLHQQIARALEEVYVTRPEEHAAELAEHFSHSSDSADLAKAVSYSEMAAQRALAVYAYGEVVRLLEQSLKVQEILDPEDKAKRCDLLIALCDALNGVPEPRRVLDVEAPAALSMAEAIGDNRRAARVCEQVFWGIHYYGVAWGTPEAAQWAERANRYAQPDTRERVWADVYLARVKSATGQAEEGLSLLKRALDLARRLGDPETLFESISALSVYLGASPQRAEERLRLDEELAAMPRAGVSIRMFSASLFNQIHHYLQLGHRQRTEELSREYHDLTERTGDVVRQILSMELDATWAAMDGRLEEAIEIGRSMLARGVERGIVRWAGGYVQTATLRSNIYLGRARALLRRTLEWGESTGVGLGAGGLALLQAHAGQDAEVKEALEQQVVERPGEGSIGLLEAAVLVGHRKAAELLLSRYSSWAMQTTGTIGYTTCIPRHLGAAAALLDRPEEARKHYQEALRICTEMKFRPELALTRLQLAELLLEHYPEERAEALEHLDFAINEFREMKMQPSLERALKHKEILGA